MSVSFGTEIFWITLAIVPIFLTLLTFIGFIFCKLFPSQARANANFYLAPSIGLAIVVIFASTLGRFVSLGGRGVFVFFVIIIIVLTLLYRQYLYQIFKSSILISVFGIICGTSILIPLFIYGAFDSHNDAFTYLAHSNWLQDYSLNKKILSNDITPLTTQVYLYQVNGFRMGGSFLLAFVQSIFSLTWSYQAYPALIISAIATCCLAMGFPIAQAFKNIERRFLLALISLPALSIGGLVFGANFGFLPQTIGLALGIGFLATIGISFRLIIGKKSSILSITKLAFLSAILFAGALFAYSEIVPFILIASLICVIFFITRFFVLKNSFIFVSIFSIFSIVLLNLEIERVIRALLTQSMAVVGTPVEWPLLGFVAHSIGIHGGAWDILQWSNIDSIKSPIFVLGLIVTGLILGMLIFNRNFIWKYSVEGTLMPVLITVMVFIFCFFYFRYIVPSPFPKGIGQSWSQFKLSDWLSPYLSVLVLFSIAALQLRSNKFFKIITLTLFCMCFVGTIAISAIRIKPFTHSYQKVSNIDKFYINFKDIVNEVCPNNSPIYLNLDGSNLKLRQMILIYLYDKEIKSNWMNDDYIYHYLSDQKQKQKPAINDCVVESDKKNDLLEVNQGVEIGPLHIGILDNKAKIRIVNISNAYPGESDGKNSWNWVKDEIKFNTEAMFASNTSNKIKISFEYNTIGSQKLNLKILERDGNSYDFVLDNNKKEFNKTMQIAPDNLSEISIKTDGDAIHIGKTDTRLAAFLIKNIRVRLVDNIE